MTIRRQAVLTVALGTSLLLLLSSVARAAGEIEPNNDIISANGPISSTTYAATLQGEGDDDWYWLQLAGGQQITFSAVFDNQECFFPDADARLRDYYGKVIANLSGPTFEPGVVDEYHYTTPPAGGTFYVEVEGDVDRENCEYEFEVSPPSAFAAPPAKPPIVPLAEPDDLDNEAHPIGAGTIYSGKIETVNDVDRLYFQAKANQTVSVELAGGGCNGKLEAAVDPPAGSKEFSQTAYASTSERGTAALKTYGGGHFDIEVTGDLGCEWQLLLSPPSALGGEAAATHHTNPCRRGKRALTRHRYRLHRLERTLRFVSPKRRVSIKHQIAAQKRAVRHAKGAILAHCPKGK